MYMTESKRPTTDEKYGRAVHARNLKVERDHTRSNIADILIAAGWSRGKLGVALMRLQSEWDGAEKPRRLSPDAVRVLATKMPRQVPLVLSEAGLRARNIRGFVAGELDAAHEAAKLTADEWHSIELGFLFQKLKTLPEVRERMSDYAWLSDMESPDVKAAALIAWWLHHVCPSCGGNKWLLIPGTNRQSGRPCLKCRGSGETSIPWGIEGRQLLAEMEESIRGAKNSMSAASR
jgi:hypothetical protein